MPAMTAGLNKMLDYMDTQEKRALKRKDSERAIVIYEVGDIFKTALGYGILLENKRALIIKGSGGRIGWEMNVGAVPINTCPIHETELETTLPYEIKLALKAARLTLNANK